MIFSDNYKEDGNIVVTDFVITERSGKDVSFSFTMPEKPASGSKVLVFSVICVQSAPVVPVPVINITKTEDTAVFDSGNIKYNASVSNKTDQSVLKVGSVQYYLNDTAIGTPVAYSSENDGYSTVIRTANTSPGTPYFNMGENKVYAVYSYSDNITTVASEALIFTLTKKDVSSNISTTNTSNAIYDGTNGKSRAQFSISRSMQGILNFNEFPITATRNNKNYSPRYEIDADAEILRFYVPDSGEYTFTITLKDTSENYTATKTLSMKVKQREITLKVADKTITIGSTLIPSYEITSGSLTAGDVITDIQYEIDTDTVGTSRIDILSYKLTNKENYIVDELTGTLHVLAASNYSKVDEAIAKANELIAGNYKDFSAVTSVINAVVRGKNIAEQATVDGYATVIKNEMKALIENPKIIAGANQTVEQGKEATFTSNANFEDFQKVLIDDEVVSSNNYILKKGSIIVTLKAEFLKTLSVGEHTLGIVSANGAANTKFIIEKATESINSDTNAPQTGDASNIFLWIATSIISMGIALMSTLRYRKSVK